GTWHLGTLIVSTDQRRNRGIRCHSECIAESGSLVLIDRAIGISDLSTFGSRFGVFPHKGPFAAAAARRNNIGDRVSDDRYCRSFAAFPFAPWAGRGLWSGSFGVFLCTPAARQFATDASSQA